MIAMLVAAALAAEPTLCDRMAGEVRRDDANGAAFRRETATLSNVLVPGVRLATSSGLSAAENDRLRAMFSDLKDSQVYAVYRLGSLWQVSLIGGTLECQLDGFVRRGADGTLTRLATPPPYASLCWTSNRQIGTVFGQSALIEQDEQTQPYEGVDVEVTPWRDGWEPPCGLRVRYDDRFTLVQRFCRDRAICAAGAALAPRWAEAMTRGGGDGSLQAVAAPPAGILAAQATAFAAASRRLDDMGADVALPTFGAKADTRYPDYSYPTHRVMVVLDGEPLLARVGIGGVGWRAIGDDLIALYRFAGGNPVPVASYVVRRTVTRLRTVATFVPKPYRDRQQVGPWGLAAITQAW